MNNKILIMSFSVAAMLLTGSGRAQETQTPPQINLGLSVVQDLDKSTAAIATVSGDELRRTSAINLQDALYGKLLGLTALKKGGFEGDGNFGASFNVRGHSTTTNNDVLILVDGFERPIDRMSVEEVESVVVLKDAAALALYGYRGANGAILVTTKRGAMGKTRVNLSYSHKLTFDPQSPDYVDGYGYAQALNEARTNDGLSPAYNKYELDAFRDNTYPLVYSDVKWKDELLRDMGSENHINLGLSGGNNAVRYYTLFNYVANKGLLSNTETNDGYSTQLKSSKANIRMNLDFTVTKTTKIAVNVAGNFIETNRPYGLDGNALFYYINYLPSSAFPVKTESGLWGGNTTYTSNNPVANAQGTGYAKKHIRTLLADIKLTQDLGVLLPGLSASAAGGYDNYAEIAESRSRGFAYESIRYTFDELGTITGTTNYSAGDMTNNLKFNKYLDQQWRRANFVVSLDYKRSFGEHNVNGSLLYNSESSVKDKRYNTIQRANWIAYGHYDYKDKYLADVVLAATGSNRAYPEKWDFSPTVSLGWLLSKEDFLKDSKVVKLLKLRASAGIIHTDYVPKDGLAFEDYSAGAGDYFFGSGYNQTWGFYMGYLPTRSFAHETANKLNLGADLAMYNGLSATAEIYYERRNNILQSGDGVNSKVFGMPSAYINKGVVDSYGVELGVNFNRRFGQVMTHVGGMFTFGTNKIVDMVETPQAYDYLSMIGKRANQRFGLEAIGIFKDQADISSSPTQEFDVVRPGDVKYKNQNGDNVIDENDMVALKYSSGLPEVNFSFTVGAEWKGLGFSLLFQGATNYYQPLLDHTAYKPMVNNANLSQHYLDNCWRAGADNSSAIYPRLTSQDSPNNYRSSTMWYADASFLKMRDCELYYNLPSSLLSKTFIKGAKVFAKGANLLSFTKLDLIDPEVPYTMYPTLKSVSFGVSLIF